MIVDLDRFVALRNVRTGRRSRKRYGPTIRIASIVPLSSSRCGSLNSISARWRISPGSKKLHRPIWPASSARWLAALMRRSIPAAESLAFGPFIG